jgi:hypothetical protein
MVAVAFVLRLDVAVHVFVPMGDDAAQHARRLLGLGGKLERDPES